VTGGFVYRGRVLGADYSGRYFFADYVSGRCWSTALEINPASGEARATNLVEHTADLGPVGSISSFGVDSAGELFLVSHSGGAIYRLIGPATAPPTPTGLRIARP
jgi:hypothetical protein